ncbi:uncharacterized protein LOC62_02G003299 [Vanrija pseudolonga]|uniref:Uncharacterized protein n=1 Tax=Vanrija pseudolonga TaxID=143232 RepID=A0AAF1BPS8_9TREE|nr:hypothetical protein LOC62_02G003299 [Vanrija pseudolonga]
MPKDNGQNTRKGDHSPYKRPNATTKDEKPKMLGGHQPTNGPPAGVDAITYYQGEVRRLKVGHQHASIVLKGAVDGLHDANKVLKKTASAKDEVWEDCCLPCFKRAGDAHLEAVAASQNWFKSVKSAMDAYHAAAMELEEAETRLKEAFQRRHSLKKINNTFHTYLCKSGRRL